MNNYSIGFLMLIVAFCNHLCYNVITLFPERSSFMKRSFLRIAILILLTAAITVSAFAIPENIEPVALLVMGYPAPDAVPNERHTVYRPTEETVFYNEF